jgi:hypothetical protein
MTPTDRDPWATAEESRDDVASLYRRAWTHSDATIEALPLEAPGRVPWWQVDQASWESYRNQLEGVARDAAAD